MAKMRHWKQHWDPEAPLVFSKRMKLGVCGKEYVEPGDPVTPEIMEALGPKAKFRLKMWWQAGRVELADWTSPEDAKRERTQTDPRLLAVTKPAPEPTGRGWYAVRTPEGELRKVRGQKAAQQMLDELWADASPEPDVSVDGQRLRDELLTETMAAGPEIEVGNRAPAGEPSPTAQGLVIEESEPRDRPLDAQE